MIRWVISFLNRCTAAVRLDREISTQKPVKIGVLQGLSVTPILFMLFTILFFKILTKDEKMAEIMIRRYVDDSFLTARASKKATSIAKIQETFSAIEVWVIENDMIFDQAKFEAIHFSCKKQFLYPEIILLPAMTTVTEESPRIIKPILKKRSMRWLGVYFNPRLSFSDHATRMASKGQKVVVRLSMLVKSTRVVKAIVMQKAVHAYILPILTYRAPAW